MVDRKGNFIEGAQMMVLIITAVLMMAVVLHVSAATPPTPTQPKQNQVVIAWTPSVLRTDKTPLAASERKEVRIYIASLATYLAAPEPATTFTYLIPWGACVRATESIQVTQVDTLGQESAPSDSKTLSADACSVGKPLPAPPAGVTVAPAF